MELMSSFQMINPSLDNIINVRFLELKHKRPQFNTYLHLRNNKYNKHK